MRDFLPPEVIERLRDRYLAGVSDALENYDQSAADEDSLTGALGQAIATKLPISVPTGNGLAQVKIGYTKLRGRGPGAAERLYGADGMFQIEVVDRIGNVMRRKGLPFQSKKEWHGSNSTLASQAAKMIRAAGSSVVIDFRRNGYYACRAEDVVRFRGQRGVVQQHGCISGLGQILGGEFLECTIGTVGLSYDALQQLFRWEAPPIHLIATAVFLPTIRPEG